MAKGDLRYRVNESINLSTPQEQKLRVFLDSGVWDGEMEEIITVTIDRQDSGDILVSLTGVRFDQPEDIEYPALIESRES